MSRFNRIAMAAASAVVLALALATLIAGGSALLAIESALSALRASPTRLALGAGAAAALSALVLLLEIRSQRRAGFHSQVGDAAVEYAPEVVARAVERHLVSLEGLRDASVQITGGGRKAGVRAQLRAEPWCDPQEVAARAQNHIREKLETSFQLAIARMRVTVQPAPYRRPAQAQHEQPVGAESSASSS